MTHPGGPGDDDADAAPPDRSGDDDRDPELRAMRAVWLSMRDEDPPDRGLGDLLAAARHQAAAMRPRPSAWQRLLAALRRPPVLAFATVTVLIAGAVLIGRRVPHEAAPSAGSAIPPSADAPAPVPATADQAVPGPPMPAPPMPAPVPPPPAAKSPARPRGGRPEPALRDATPSPARRPGDAPAPAKGAPRLGVFSEDSAVETTETAVANDTANGAANQAPDNDPRSDGNDDLYRQCEAAALRSDCATVQRLVRRITTTDRGYRARLAKGSPVSRCLAAE